MTLDEALSEAILGARVRCVTMQPGAYIDYNFNGWRINFEGGSSSGWTPRELDEQAEWVEVPIGQPKPLDSWGRPLVDKPVDPQPVLMQNAEGKWGAPRPVDNKWGTGQ